MSYVPMDGCVCGRQKPEKNNYCSLKCFKERHDIPLDSPLPKRLWVENNENDIKEEDV